MSYLTAGKNTIAPVRVYPTPDLICDICPQLSSQPHEAAAAMTANLELNDYKNVHYVLGYKQNSQNKPIEHVVVKIDGNYHDPLLEEAEDDPAGYLFTPVWTISLSDLNGFIESLNRFPTIYDLITRENKHEQRIV